MMPLAAKFQKRISAANKRHQRLTSNDINIANDVIHKVIMTDMLSGGNS